MAHKHSVYDTDPHFSINPITRAIKNESSGKVTLIQGDHNSERFSFDMPRMIEEHDMLQCDKVKVHFINTGKDGTTADAHDVEDFQVSPDGDDTVVFSWLISGNATKHVGPLQFAVEFLCTTDGVIDYAWHTAVFAGISVSTGMNNGEAIVEQYSDILEQWREQLFSGASNEISPEDIQEAVNNYLTDNPVQTTEIDETLKKSGAAADAAVTGQKISELENNKLDASKLSEAVNTALTQAKESGQFDGDPGDPGEPGQAATLEIVGADSLAYGSTPTVTEEEGSTAQARKYRLGIPEGKPSSSSDPASGGAGIDDENVSGETTYSSQKIKELLDPLNTGITRVESLDTTTPGGLVNLRDLETGLYVLYGYFSPYANSDMSMIFDNTMVVVSRKTAGSHLLVFTGLNSKVNFLEILVDESQPGGHTYTRTDFVMLDMHNLIAQVGSLESLSTEDKSSIVAAINELAQKNAGGSSVELDTTLAVSGQAADAKATGDAIAAEKTAREQALNELKEANANLAETKVSITDITLGKHTDGLIYIFIGGQPVGDGLEITGGSIVEPVYGQPTTDNALLKMVQNSTAMLGVKLDAEPSQNQTITVLNDNGVLTFDKETLEFTPENWNEYQFITVTAGTVEADGISNIVLRNSDKLMTDKSIPVYVVAEGYAVDTTIPDGAHVVTADDFEYSIHNGTDSVYTKKYIGTHPNIYLPNTVEVDGVEKTLIVGLDTFKESTVLQYVNVENGSYINTMPARQNNWSGAFKGCTNLIGVKYDGSDITTLYECFNGCTSLKFFDGLEKQTNCTSLYMTFCNCSALEYVQDFSALTKITSLGQVFNGCSSLKRVFGLPSPEAACTWYMAFFNCGQLAQNIEVPEKASDIRFAFTNDANLRRVTINNDNMTSSEINDGTFRGCQELSVYATEGSTTYETLLDIYGASADVTIKDISGLSAPLIVTWGDSTTSTDTGWTMYFKDKVEGYAVNNQAVSGEFTTSTSARQGGNALKVGAFTIPADVSQVEITLTSSDGQAFAGGGPRFSAGASFNPCTIAGVPGIISSNSGVYYFTRITAGESVSVSDQTVVTSNADDLLNAANNVMLIDLGTNSGWNFDADILLNQVQLMVDHFTAKGGTKYIICGASSGKHLNGEENMAIWLEYEQKAATAFGDHWLNMREYLIQNGLTENGLTATALDNERMAQGLIPASLLVGPILSDGVTLEDDTHPNAYGHNSKSNAFYNKGVALGYWD